MKGKKQKGQNRNGSKKLSDEIKVPSLIPIHKINVLVSTYVHYYLKGMW